MKTFVPFLEQSRRTHREEAWNTSDHLRFAVSLDAEALLATSQTGGVERTTRCRSAMSHAAAAPTSAAHPGALKNRAAMASTLIAMVVMASNLIAAQKHKWEQLCYDTN